MHIWSIIDWLIVMVFYVVLQLSQPYNGGRRTIIERNIPPCLYIFCCKCMSVVNRFFESSFLFVCLFVCLDFSRIFHSYGDVTITGEGLIIFTYARHLWPLSSESSLACHAYCTWHGAPVYNGHLRGPMTITFIAEINVLCKRKPCKIKPHMLKDMENTIFSSAELKPHVNFSGRPSFVCPSVS